MKAKLIKTADEQGTMYSLSGDNLPDNYVLSKQNCDEIFGVVDVEKLAEKLSPNSSWKHGFIKGFNKAMELNKDKLFTMEQMNRAIHLACSEYLGNIIDEVTQQPAEIEVMIVMEEVQEIYRDGTVKWERVPVFDADGCLILKRK
jgi:hypothetical protein